jgi:DNA-binding GntR family transcriptional regulator
MGELGIPLITDYQPVRDLVLQRLRDAILEGTLRPGTRLKINDVATELGVSHMPVREALHLLVVEGLAVRLPRRGVVVRPLTAEDVTSAYDVMGVLEGLAARQAAGRLSPAALQDLQNLLDQMQSLIERDDREALLRMNRAFHSRIYEASGNKWAGEFLRQLWNYTYRVRRLIPQSPARLRQAAVEHRAILEALAACDGVAAEQLVREHCARARDDVLAQLMEDASRATLPPGAPAG